MVRWLAGSGDPTPAHTTYIYEARPQLDEVGPSTTIAGTEVTQTDPYGRQTIAVYDDFCHANDPYGEHDFGSFEADDQKIFFKIDYLDKALTAHSPDPSDPSVTERVITIMLAEEY